MKYIKIRWKYRLVEPVSIKTIVRPKDDLETEWIRLEQDGTLTLAAGYAWDGASGPAIDTADFMRGSACHDGLFQLMKLGLLDKDEQVGSFTIFNLANLALCDICRKDGMSEPRIAYVYEAVERFGKKHLEINDEAKIYTAP